MKNKITIFQLLFALFFCLPVIHAQKLVDRTFTKSTTQIISLNYEHLATKSSGLNLPLDLGEYGVYDLDLEQTYMFSDGYLARKAKKNDKSKLPLTFKGTVQGQPNTKVSLTTNDGFLSGFIDTGEEVIWFEPYKNFNADAVENELIIYYQKDVIDKGHTCAANHTDKQAEHIETQNNQLKSAATGCYVVEIVLVADYGMYVRHGANTLSHIVSVLNNVGNNYDNEFNDPITFDCVDDYIATSSSMNKWSSTTDASTLLGEFRDSDFTEVNYDLASLWVTRNIASTNDDGTPRPSTVGFAYEPGVCTSSRYNLIEDYSSTATDLRVLFAHEIGHNFGAKHDPADSGTIMAPAVNNTTTWSEQSQNQINAFYPDATCLCFGDFVDLQVTSCLTISFGTTIQYTTGVRNSGNTTAGESTLGIYLSSDNQVNTNDFRVATASIPSLSGDAASSSVSISFDPKTVTGVPGGNYYIGLVADADNNITESNENNNVNCVSPSAFITIDGEVCATVSEPPVISNTQLYFDCDDGNIGRELTLSNLDPAYAYEIHYTTDLVYGPWQTAVSGVGISGSTTTWNDCDEPNRDLAFYRIDGTCDSDGDGLSDAYEMLSTGTNPFEADTDADGVPDSTEDSDCDGFTNADEYTNPNMGAAPNCNNNCYDNRVIAGEIVQEVYSVNTLISTAGDVIVNGTTTFRAGERIELNPGFVAELGSKFVAEIGPCSSSGSGAKKPTTNTGSLLVYPNPIKSDENLNIEFDIDVDKEDAIFTIHNINGQVVHQETINVQKGENTINVFLNNYTSGMYLITIQAGTRALNSKLIIQ